MSSRDVTIKDVARARRRLADDRLARDQRQRAGQPGHARRVEQAISELGYVPSRLARGLSAAAERARSP